MKFAVALLLLMTRGLWAADYFELRIYDVTPNKLDGVLERFRETVEPVRRKHEIDTVGYWFATSTNEPKFAYLLRAPSSDDLKAREKNFGADPDFQKGYAAFNAKHGKTVDKITSLPLSWICDSNLKPAASARTFDLRIYTVLPGRLSAFEQRWREHATRIYERHGLRSVGCWRGPIENDGSAKFVCLLAAPSAESIQQAIGEFHKDAEWQRIEAESERDGKLRSSVTSYKLIPADFSKLK